MGGRAATVLVVADNWLLAAIVAAQVRALGHDVLGPANSLPQAAALIDASPPDAVLLDIELGREESFRSPTHLHRSGFHLPS